MYICIFIYLTRAFNTVFSVTKRHIFCSLLAVHSLLGDLSFFFFFLQNVQERHRCLFAVRPCAIQFHVRRREIHSSRKHSIATLFPVVPKSSLEKQSSYAIKKKYEMHMAERHCAGHFFFFLFRCNAA
uniref:Uncharacterized protein n=1 Tax=Rhipicephalus zambeziensis TaxID=60191 RepID=A0A224YLD2_9ACAR